MAESAYVSGKVKNKTWLKGNVAQTLPEGKNSKSTLFPASLEVTVWGSVLYQNFPKPYLLVFSNKSPNNNPNLDRERDLEENSIGQ